MDTEQRNLHKRRSVPKDIEPCIPLLERLAAERDISLIILFGSRAKGIPRADSDYDLGVLFTGSPPEPSILRLVHHELQHMFHTDRVDMAILNDASPLLQYQVSRSGVPLVEAVPGAFASFCVRAVQRHNDARSFYAAERRYLSLHLGKRNADG